MQQIDIKIKKVREDIPIELPEKMSSGASGFDIRVALKEDIVLKPFERALVPTGIAISIPEGYEAQIRPRSGLAIKYGITLLNTPGTIDSDYRGEICLIVINLGNEKFHITNGMRLAQMVVAEHAALNPVIVEELNDTIRGAGGLGHTGV